MRIAAVLAGGIAFALFTWWLDRRMLGIATDAYLGVPTVLANALPGLVLACLLTSLTRRPGFSLLLVAGLQGALYQAGTIKLAVLDDPIGLQDFYFVTSLDRTSVAVLGSYIAHPWRLLAAVLVVLALAVALWRIERPALRTIGAGRLALGVLSIALLASLWMSGPPWSRWYTKDTVRSSRFEAMPAILHAGLMSNLVYTHNKNMRTFNAVDIVALQQLLATVPVHAAPGAGNGVKPDIVIVLSESLFDPRIMKGMAALPDMIPNVRAAIGDGHGGAMKVPTFGGGTIRTEFEVLTGMPMEAFPDAQFPYVSLVRDRIPGLVSLVKQQGYRAVAIHGNAGSFWNRQNAYKAIGFDRFITENQFPPGAERNGRWISDSAMTDRILAELHSDPPVMVFAISIEAHGPYADQRFAHAAQRDAVQVPTKLEASQALELRNYLYHANRADAEFGRLLEALKHRPRPTVLLFFGDHLPGLLGTFRALGFEDGKEATRQHVPWVLLRTDQPTASASASGIKESWMLPGALLRVAGLDDDPYFGLTQALTGRIKIQSQAQADPLRRGLYAAAAARINGTFASYVKDAPTASTAPEAR